MFFVLNVHTAADAKTSSYDGVLKQIIYYYDARVEKEVGFKIVNELLIRFLMHLVKFGLFAKE